MTKNKGFSLVEVLIAVFILGIIGLAVFYFSAHSFSFFSDADKSSRANLTTEEVRFTLEAPGQCIKNFKDKDFITAPVTPNPITEVAFYDLASGNKINTVALVSTLLDRGLTLTDMTLNPSFKAGVISTGTLELTFKKSTDGNSIKRVLPFFAATESGKIKDCWISLPQSYRVTFQACQAISGGLPNAYDPLTGKCAVMGMKWYDGTPYAASCPAPATLPAGASNLRNCKADTSTWIDTGTVTSLPLSNGTTYNGQRHPYITSLNTSSNSCTCTWATDVPPNVIPTFKCQVLCISP